MNVSTPSGTGLEAGRAARLRLGAWGSALDGQLRAAAAQTSAREMLKMPTRRTMLPEPAERPKRFY
ncbi:hypothetical protein CHLRE_06g278106v5 [Chlamydomonas reinhardtii]|uniref:Uncharacterized protein n=1 Tax=Chlamydomonas reinhardtii TaxID=3055 RepID=A0A2K3DNV3_CHLRE|nr:uncharacterized protein CHLRE_06g278106v5 [Chlamydomonas reinhardtii]PNW82212.1 hypothetical protein CHLRE_06g278106v5 [Chlamydomonas reinhardtii]